MIAFSLRCSKPNRVAVMRSRAAFSPKFIVLIPRTKVMHESQTKVMHLLHFAASILLR
jgi:hypothetical protein